MPRPIGWISTIAPARPDLAPSHQVDPPRGGHVRNLAPFSQFQNLTFDPPYVMFSANQSASFGGTRKDTVRNVEETGVFCWSMATWELRDAVNRSAEELPWEVDEFERVGLEVRESEVVCLGGGHGASPIRVPMVEKSPVNFECRYHSTVRLPGNPPMGSVDIVIGRVVGIHIAEWALTDGKVDLGRCRPIARCGYYEYAVVGRENMFEMVIPSTDGKVLDGLEGSTARNRDMAEERRVNKSTTAVDYRSEGQLEEQSSEGKQGERAQGMR